MIFLDFATAEHKLYTDIKVFCSLLCFSRALGWKDQQTDIH